MAYAGAVPTLLPHQQPAVEWLASRDAGLVAVAPGLGKTPIAIEAAKRRGFPHVAVVAPLTLRNVWKREFARWWPERVPLVLTYDEFRLHGVPTWMKHVIFDESVLLKNRRAKRTQRAMHDRRRWQTVWMLSGSPTTRFHDDLWAQLRILNHKKYASYWDFTYQYCLTRKANWGQIITEVIGNVPHAEAQLHQDCKDELYAYNYADLERDHPEQAIPAWTFESRDVPLSDSHWKVYREMQRRFVAELPSGDTLVAPNVLVQVIRLLQLASGMWMFDEDSQDEGKLAGLWEILLTLPAPTILWVNFVATGQRLSQRLKAPLLTGDTPAAERTAIVDALQDGKHPLLIAHPGVGKFGLTLTAARSAVYVERSYDGDSFYQSLYRIRRIGTTQPPQVVHLLATGPNGEKSIDHVIDKVLSYRKGAATKLTTNTLRETLDAA